MNLFYIFADTLILLEPFENETIDIFLCHIFTL